MGKCLTGPGQNTQNCQPLLINFHCCKPSFKYFFCYLRADNFQIFWLGCKPMPTYVCFLISQKGGESGISEGFSKYVHQSTVWGGCCLVLSPDRNFRLGSSLNWTNSSSQHRLLEHSVKIKNLPVLKKLYIFWRTKRLVLDSWIAIITGNLGENVR